jgi:hypothetical protein
VVVPGLESASRHDVDPDAQELLEILEQADVIKERRTGLEIHEQVEITVWASLAPSDRTEHRDPMCPMLPRNVENLGSTAAQILHGQHVTGHPSRVTPRARRTFVQQEEQVVIGELPPGRGRGRLAG